MVRSGRDVTLTALIDWRNDGLLPPLANRGAGPGKGKYYFWGEDNIFEQACFVHDLVQKGARADSTILALWLAGFPVPLVRFRRAWLHKARARGPWSAKQSSLASMVSNGEKQVNFPHSKFNKVKSTPADLMFGALLSVVEALAPEGRTSELDIFEHLIDQVITAMSVDGAPTFLERRTIARHLRLIFAVWSVLEGSDLISVASDLELINAQRFLSVAAQFIGTVANSPNAVSQSQRAPFWPARLATDIGGPLFAFILILVRGGHEKELELTALELAKLSGKFKGTSGSRQLARQRKPVVKKVVISTFRRRMLTIWRPVL
jgi:hypothetical protein